MNRLAALVEREQFPLGPIHNIIDALLCKHLLRRMLHNTIMLRISIVEVRESVHSGPRDGVGGNFGRPSGVTRDPARPGAQDIADGGDVHCTFELRGDATVLSRPSLCRSAGRLPPPALRAGSLWH